ncbi:MAG: hypothetical protein GWN79_15910, partial [Actinobacteria bacterium]|nr:hypothetical protein [Actinomycetota bacterium]NIS33286.1 hypothetical protein [Actinomycetota bacterium]NIT96783.1 hypothetical protein [Actinomycetota bacterium]NIU20467.1 hypothetical protein [Actinomycetota bacterium]NIU68192.1 hypothetical protein [Actinomycetota bacterium]
EVFGTDIPDAAVFRDRTIRGLAAVVDAHRGGVVGTTAIDALPAPDPTAPLALSAGEEAMLFEYRSDPADTRYNVTRLYRLRGDVDVDRLESALRDVVMAHEPLHTLFDPARTRLGSADAVEFVARGTMSIEEMDAFADVRRRVPFDLDHGPLVRVDHARIADDEVAVLIGMHHITIDAGTFDTFWSQVAARAAGGPLPPLPLSYHDHTRIQAAELAGDRSHH